MSSFFIGGSFLFSVVFFTVVCIGFYNGPNYEYWSRFIYIRRKSEPKMVLISQNLQYKLTSVFILMSFHKNYSFFVVVLSRTQRTRRWFVDFRYISNVEGSRVYCCRSVSLCHWMPGVEFVFCSSEIRKRFGGGLPSSVDPIDGDPEGSSPSST